MKKQKLIIKPDSFGAVLEIMKEVGAVETSIDKDGEEIVWLSEKWQKMKVIPLTGCSIGIDTTIS